METTYTLTNATNTLVAEFVPYTSSTRGAMVRFVLREAKAETSREGKVRYRCHTALWLPLDEGRAKYRSLSSKGWAA